MKPWEGMGFICQDQPTALCTRVVVLDSYIETLNLDRASWEMVLRPVSLRDFSEDLTNTFWKQHWWRTGLGSFVNSFFLNVQMHMSRSNPNTLGSCTRQLLLQIISLIPFPGTSV